ncbi:DUF488 family protein [Edaphobacter aggregans]|uniref:DUF488 domain-containing protein n=1 Tax=Edaphobacter aggregans TaxID=570835 RepID=UPI00054D0C99|nr:DUF488 domain-containing protein [Edaphobacter aggregans]
MMTIGHSTLTIEAFLRALRDNGVRMLVDVRRFPGSRRHPQFTQAALFRRLEEAGIRGVWREGMGGRREAVAGSVNTGWRNESFRGYADYMQTAQFEAEVDWLVGLPEIDQTVVMCAEAVPWRCHRSLITDAVMARGVAVEDVFVKADGESERRPHVMTSFAQVSGGRVWYPKEPVLFG